MTNGENSKLEISCAQICVPKADLEQRKREVREGKAMAGRTADTYEKIMSLDPLVTIDQVDVFGMPWFSYELVAKDGAVEYHTLGITDDVSWEYAIKNKEQ